MPNVKISDLPAASSAAGTDQLETSQGGTSRRLTVAQVATHVRSTATDTVVVAAGSAAAPSIAPTGDSNTGLWAPAADTLAFSTGGTERLRINSSGQSEFVAGSASTPAVTTTGDTNTGIFFPAADTIAFSEGGVEAMRIDASGNVGIGTSSPRSRLDIAGGILSGVGNIGGNSNSSAYSIWGGADSLNGGYVQFYGASHPSPNIVVFGNSSLGEAARITSGGDVLIGTTTPSGKLTVNGAVTLTNQDFAFYARSGSSTTTGYAGGQTVANSIWANDRISANEFNARSDGRLKKDVAPIPASDAWHFIQNVTPVHYKWIGSVDDGHKFGFIAQDVAKAGFPNLVGQYPDSNVQEVTDADGFTSPAGVMLSVNYDQIVPVLASALRDALAQIDALKARVAALEAAPAQA